MDQQIVLPRAVRRGLRYRALLSFELVQEQAGFVRKRMIPDCLATYVHVVEVDVLVIGHEADSRCFWNFAFDLSILVKLLLITIQSLEDTLTEGFEKTLVESFLADINQE